MSTKTIYTFKSRVWQLRSWYMVSLPKDKSDGLKKLYRGLTGGFGSLPVQATIGKTSWKTSMFPEDRSGPFMLPLKKAVRSAEQFTRGDTITYTIEVLV